MQLFRDKIVAFKEDKKMYDIFYIIPVIFIFSYL